MAIAPYETMRQSYKKALEGMKEPYHNVLGTQPKTTQPVVDYRQPPARGFGRPNYLVGPGKMSEWQA